MVMFGRVKQQKQKAVQAGEPITRMVDNLYSLLRRSRSEIRELEHRIDLVERKFRSESAQASRIAARAKGDGQEGAKPLQEVVKHSLVTGRPVRRK